MPKDKTPPNERRLARYRELRQNPYVTNFLDMIANYEAGTTGPEGYGIMVGGGTLEDFSKHPNKKIKTRFGPSTAAGRYQFLGSTWNDIQQRLTGPLPDFGPENQDVAILAYMESRGIDLNTIAQGDYSGVFAGSQGKALSSIFASLPAERDDGTYYYAWPKQGYVKPDEAKQWLEGRVASLDGYVQQQSRPVSQASPFGMSAGSPPQFSYGAPTATATYGQAVGGQEGEEQEQEQEGPNPYEQAMELAAGPSLYAQFEQEGPLPMMQSAYQVTPWMRSMATQRMRSMIGMSMAVERDGRRFQFKITDRVVKELDELLSQKQGRTLTASRSNDPVDDIIYKALHGEV